MSNNRFCYISDIIYSNIKNIVQNRLFCYNMKVIFIDTEVHKYRKALSIKKYILLNEKSRTATFTSEQFTVLAKKKSAVFSLAYFLSVEDIM